MPTPHALIEPIIRAITAYEDDRVFGPAQIIIVPALIFLACAVYGTM